MRRILYPAHFYLILIINAQKSYFTIRKLQ
nr:MAG TPA: hypothetical protein [Bacteriophage sp.]DAH63045.1 MAG TPA: hypothetical protein [Bacteriophage sp.]